MFHNVVPDHKIAGQEHQSVSMKLSVFQAAINQISSLFKIVSLESYFSVWRKNRCLPTRYAVISFDDLTRTTLDCAIPSLINRGIPSIGYAVTSQIDTDNLMWTAYINALCFDSHYRFIEIGDQIISLKSLKSKKLARRHLIGMARDTRNPIAFVQNLSSRYILNPDQISNYLGPTASQLYHYARTSLFHIGCHTHNHPYLSELCYSTQFEEISTSQNIIRDISESSVDHFSFPFGDFNSTTLRVLSDLNFSSSCSVKYLLNSNSKVNYQIPRIGVYGDFFIKNLTKILLHWRSFRSLEIC